MKSEFRLADKTIDRADLKELVAWLETDPWLTMGPLVREFEKRWSAWLGTKYSVYVNSGSSANLLMYYAPLVSGRLENKKVVVPAVSWATTVAPAVQLGFEPVLCEADPNHFGVELGALETLLKKHHPSMVVLVHVLGVPNDMKEILSLQRKFGFLLLEDSCAAMGSRYDGKKVGTFGDLSTFSFYYGHHLSTIEGGMVSTDDEKFYDTLLQIRSHGWAKDLAKEKEAKLAKQRKVIEFNRPFTFYHPGFNVRSTDLNAKIGLSQLQKADEVVRRRVENHKVYQSRFLRSEDFQCQRNDRAEISSISFAALAHSEEHRERVAKKLREKRIETRPLGGGNMSRQPFWSDRYGTTVYPMADRIHATSFQLPNHPIIAVDEIEYICDTVLSVPA